MARLDVLAVREAALRGMDSAAILDYWTNCVHYRLGERELQGLQRFAELAARHDLVSRCREVAVAEA
jgi:predicted solute-binding protein